MRRCVTVTLALLLVAIAATGLRGTGEPGKAASRRMSSPEPEATSVPLGCADDAITPTLEMVLRLRSEVGATAPAEVLDETRAIVARRAALVSPDGRRVWPDGEDEILVQFAGDVAAEAARSISSSARLEIIDPGGEFLASGTVVQTIPANDLSSPEATPPYPVIVDSHEIVDAILTTDATGQFVVGFQLAPEAAQRFCTFTSRNVGLPLSF